MVVLVAFQANAQFEQNDTSFVDDLLLPEEIDIIKEYEPVLAKSRRINFAAELPKKSDKPIKSGGSYFNPPKFINTSFDPPQLKPLAAQSQTLDRVHNFWLKAGYGVPETPVIDASLNTGLTSRLNAGIQFKYDAALAELSNQAHKDLYGRIFGKLMGDKSYFQAAVDYDNKTNYYYGYNALIEGDTTVVADSVKQQLQDYGLAIKTGNQRELKSDIDYELNFNGNYLTDLYENNNLVSDLDAYARRNFNANYLKLGLGIDFSNYTLTDSTYNDALLNLNPEFHIGAIGLSIGANAGLLNDETYIYPKILLDVYAIKDKLAFYGGWEQFAYLNTYREFLHQNPFLSSFVNIEPSIYEDRYIGVKGQLNKNIAFNVKVKSQLAKNLPLFVNDDSDFNKFEVQYNDSTIITSVLPQLTFRLNDKIEINGSAEIANYDLIDSLVIRRAYHLPELYLNAGVQLKPVKNLNITAQLYFIDGRSAKTENGAITELETITDFNLLADYKIRENIGIFLEGKNLLNQTYQNWYRYEAYGAQFRGGIKLKF